LRYRFDERPMAARWLANFAARCGNPTANNPTSRTQIDTIENND
jgi:hypothetical protein